MKKLLLILQAVTLLGMSNIVYADTVTGHVDAVSYCEGASDNWTTLFKVDGSWYRSQTRTGGNAAQYHVELQSIMTLALAAMTAGKTVTLIFDAEAGSYCGKSVVGRVDYHNGYGDIQVNAN